MLSKMYAIHCFMYVANAVCNTVHNAVCDVCSYVILYVTLYNAVCDVCSYIILYVILYNAVCDVCG